MSTAHRPTFHPAVGSSTPGGFRYHAPRQGVHSKDQHAQLTIKYRQPAQQSSTPSTDDAKQQLEQREQKGRADKKRPRDDDEDDEGDRARDSSKPHKQLLLTSGDEKKDKGEAETEESKEETEEGEDEPVKLDVSKVDLSQFDDADAVLSDREQDDSDDDADDTSDDEAELQRELEKIKREREAERKAKADEEAAAQAASTALLNSNPLLAAGTASFGAKRRWDDDVVFRNQSRGDVTEKVKKRFINDSIRNDFHKSFLKRYVR